MSVHSIAISSYASFIKDSVNELGILEVASKIGLPENEMVLITTDDELGHIASKIAHSKLESNPSTAVFLSKQDLVDPTLFKKYEEQTPFGRLWFLLPLEQVSDLMLKTLDYYDIEQIDLTLDKPDAVYFIQTKKKKMSLL